MIKSACKSMILIVSGFLVISDPSVTFADDPPYEQVFSNKSATGEELVSAFLNLASHTGSPTGTVGTTKEQDKASKSLIKPYLDPTFMLQRASGQRYTAETFLPADLDDFKVGDVRETRPADDVVVMRYSVRASQTLPDAALVMSKDKAPRLTVFHWSDTDSRWKVVSHANFNTPVAAICDKTPLIDNGLESSASSEDQKLGIDLAKRLFTLLEQGDGRPIMNAQVQVQTAGGTGYTGVSEYKPGKLKGVELDHIVVTRNDKLVVVSLYAKATDTVFGNAVQLGVEEKPRLLTFLQDENKDWSVIAIATFNPPKELSKDLACVPAGAVEQAP